MDDFDVMEILEGGEDVVVDESSEEEEEEVAAKEIKESVYVPEERSELELFNEEELSKLKYDKSDVTECKYPRVKDMDMGGDVYPSVSFVTG